MKLTRFALEGMHCEGCAGRIRGLLTREPGVRHAEVSFTEGMAGVRYNPHAVDVARLREIIAMAGFAVVEKTT